MLISLGPQAFISPAPVMLVGTYDAEGRPNIMTGDMGRRKLFAASVSFGFSSPLHVDLPRGAAEKGVYGEHSREGNGGQADFAGLVSGSQENKFQTLGLTPVPGDHVDAPFVAECPVVLELLLRHTLELGSHIQFVGEIMDSRALRGIV